MKFHLLAKPRRWRRPTGRRGSRTGIPSQLRVNTTKQWPRTSQQRSWWKGAWDKLMQQSGLSLSPSRPLGRSTVVCLVSSLCLWSSCEGEGRKLMWLCQVVYPDQHSGIHTSAEGAEGAGGCFSCTCTGVAGSSSGEMICILLLWLHSCFRVRTEPAGAVNSCPC